MDCAALHANGPLTGRLYGDSERSDGVPQWSTGEALRPTTSVRGGGRNEDRNTQKRSEQTCFERSDAISFTEVSVRPLKSTGAVEFYAKCHSSSGLAFRPATAPVGLAKGERNQTGGAAATEARNYVELNAVSCHQRLAETLRKWQGARLEYIFHRQCQTARRGPDAVAYSTMRGARSFYREKHIGLTN